MGVISEAYARLNGGGHLTSGGVAVVTGLSQQTVIRMADEGSIPSFRLPSGGRHRRFRRDALTAWAKRSGLAMEWWRLDGTTPPAEPVGEPRPTAPAGPDPTAGGGTTLEDIKRRAVLACLARHRGNKTATVAELQISTKTLYNLLTRWELSGHVTLAWLDSLTADKEGS